ncbi:MAG: hypothetical protein ACMXYG_06085 [Candidatus Woesearchaeota archaeon]
MKYIEKTWNYIKNNKTRTFVLIFLEVIFMIIALNLILTYVPPISENIEEYYEILQLAGPEQAIDRLTERTDDIIRLEKELNKLFLNLILYLVIAFNIFFLLSITIIIKSLDKKQILRILISLVSTQLIMVLLFDLIVGIKTITVDVFSQSRLSLFIFILIGYVMYYLIMMAVIPKEPIYFIKKRWSGFFVRFIVVNILGIMLLLFTQVPLLIDNAISIIIMILFLVIIFIPYQPISKIYLVQILNQKIRK